LKFFPISDKIRANEMSIVESQADYPGGRLIAHGKREVQYTGCVYGQHLSKPDG
jgi:hypothetical protein